jgi:hypothetical protein
MLQRCAFRLAYIGSNLFESLDRKGLIIFSTMYTAWWESGLGCLRMELATTSCERGWFKFGEANNCPGDPSVLRVG